MRAQRSDGALPRNIIAVRRNMDYQRLLSNNNNNYPTHHREYPTISSPYSPHGAIIFGASTPTRRYCALPDRPFQQKREKKITVIVVVAARERLYGEPHNARIKKYLQECVSLLRRVSPSRERLLFFFFFLPSSFQSRRAIFIYHASLNERCDLGEEGGE